MNEKSNPMPMMYKTIPAVAELNKVPGFDPLKFLRHKVSRKTNEEMLQLELPYQKLWFRLRHPQGRMKLTTLRITEQLAIMEARVYLDRSDAEPISSYISQHSAEEGTDYVQAAQDEALSAALSDAGFGLQFADVAVDSTGKVFGSSIPLSGAAPIQQPMPDAAQRPVEASGAALRQSGGEVHARLERAPQSVVERRNAPARPTSIQKPAAKPVQNEQPPVSPVQPTVQQMAAEEKENMDVYDEIVYRTRKLRRRHDDLVLKCQEKDIELQAEEMEEKFPHVNAICQEIKTKYEYADADYMVVVPSGILDIITEGRALHHCVGSSDRYWDRIERRESFVMFLRNYRMPVYIFIMFIGVFGIINLLNTLITNILTRKRELGVLQAVGLSSKQLSKMLLIEGLFYTLGVLLLSISCGTLIGYLLCTVFSAMSIFGKVSYHFPTVEMFSYFILMLAVQMLFSCFAIRQIKKQSLVDQIRELS